MAKEIQFMDSRKLPGKAIKITFFQKDVFIQDERSDGVDVYGQF
jgi:hypothetical protein